MRRVSFFAVPLVGLLLLAGCADSDKAVTTAPPTVGANGVPTRAGAGYAKEGWFGNADGLHARVEIKAVERQATKTVLRYGVTSLDSSPKSVTFAMELLDPVGRKLYKPTGSTSGDSFAPGTAREMAAEYPAIAPGVQKVTVLTPGTAGEFTGIPVTTSSGTPGMPTGPSAPGMPTGPGAPSGTGVPTWSGPPSGSTPSSGAPSTGASPRVQMSLRAQPAEPYGATPSPSESVGIYDGIPPGGFPTGGTPGPGGTPSGGPLPGGSPLPGATGPNPVDLYDITEGPNQDVTSSGSEVTVALHTNVLFKEGSATLSGEAKPVLDQVAQQIKAKASRSLKFEGHTDGRGDDARNLKLSKDQAEAVLKEIKSRVGAGFSYSSSGMGKSQPVAREGGLEDAAARTRNRRVEITFPVRQTPATGGPQPAAFHAQDGKTVSNRTVQFGSAKRRMDVKPFYRDGAYIVAVFDIVNLGPGTTPPDASYPDKDYPGGPFTAFSVKVQGSYDAFRAVRVGTATAGSVGAYVDPGRAVFRTAVNQPVRGFVYMPAPPGNATAVTFDAGPFGTFDRVPVS